MKNLVTIEYQELSIEKLDVFTLLFIYSFPA